MQNFTDVYYAPLPEVLGRRGIFPPERETYILQTPNPLLQRQRYYVWLLLDYALTNSFQRGVYEMNVTQTEHGTWISPFCHFSLSHSDNAVAVAVGTSPVGVDIQKRITKLDISKHILTPEEETAFSTSNNPSDFLTELWTKKESIFKAGNALRFQPKTLCANAHYTATRWLDINGERYALSVSAPIRNFEQVQL